ncbi:Kelch repeat and BTB domain-containing 4, partial [Brachionus plicatilis]
ILPNNTFNDTIRPIFECNTFEYDSSLGIIEMSSSNLNFEFEVSFEPLETDEKTNKNSIMVLSNEQGNFKLICQRVMAIENFDKQFNFADMLNNEFMSDIMIKTSSGRCFYAQKIILSLTLKEKTEMFVKDLNELRNEPELIELVLIFLYTNSLSNKIEMSENTIVQEKKLESLVKFLQRYSELDEFTLILKTFLDNNSFKEVFNLLINDVKKCSELINAKIKYNESINNNNHLFSDPAKLVQILKFCLNQISLAFIKIIRLLDLFAGKQNQLSKKEKIEFISKIENCFPFFVEQFKQLLVSLHKHSQQSTEQHKREVAEYLVPELDKFVDNMLNLIKCWEDSIEKIISNKKSKNSKSNRKISDEEEDDQEEVSSQKHGKKLKKKLGKSIKTAMHVRELKKIQKFSDIIKKKISKLESSL